jgi:hypothetical protein
VQIDDSVPEDDGETTENKSSVEFGPHPKFTRAYEKYALEKEMRMVNEKQVVCSLDLLLDIFPKVLSDSGLQLYSTCETSLCWYYLNCELFLPIWTYI